MTTENVIWDYQTLRIQAVAMATNEMPNVADADQYIAALDERQFYTMRRAVIKLRQTYVSLYRFLSNNRDQVEHPAGSDDPPWWQ